MLIALILASSLFGHNADRGEDSVIYSTGDDNLYQFHDDGSTTVIYTLERRNRDEEKDSILYDGYGGYGGPGRLPPE